MNINSENIQMYSINQTVNIRQAVKQIDKGGIGFIAITDNDDRVVGIITDGDFRRAILNGVNLDSNVLEITNKDFLFVENDYTQKEVINVFLKKPVNVVPVLKNKKLFTILFRQDFDLEHKVVLPEQYLNIPVVIMAGGKGTRMKPFTNIFPKPLIPVGDRSMLEVIMDEYKNMGLKTLFLRLITKPV